MTLSFGGGAGVLTIPGLTSDGADGIDVAENVMAGGLATLKTVKINGDGTAGAQLEVDGIGGAIALSAQGDGGVTSDLASWSLGADGTVSGRVLSALDSIGADGGFGVWGFGVFDAQPVLATGAGKTADDIIALLQSYGLCKQA